MPQKYRKVHRYAVELVLIFVASYFVIRKTTSFSGSELIKDVFQPVAAGYTVNILTIIVFYALVARLFIYTRDYFATLDVPHLGFPHYRCLLNNNKEIEKHIKELKGGGLALNHIDDKHSYEENMQIIHRNFSEHLLASLKDKGLSASDIFLSLFHDEEFRLDFERLSVFHYSSHYDPTLHNTSTSKLDLNNFQYRGFAGVTAIRKKTPVICHQIDNDNYEVGEEERRQAVKHYIGIPLKINGCVVGLLNIEFHNKAVFSNEDEMKLFYQKEIQAFTYLYEYQIHKKYFFKHLPQKVLT